MKIISKFADYYDSVGKQFLGIQDQQIGLRKTTEVTDSTLKKRIVSELQFSNRFNGCFRECLHRNIIVFESYCIAFSGYIVPLVKVTKSNEHECIESFNYSYESLHLNSPVKLSNWRVKSFYEIFSKKDKVLPLEFWNELQTPLFILKFRSHLFGDTTPFLITNPNLNKLEFFRIKDPFTCYQELDQFLTKLTKPEEIHPQIDDLTRLIEHGFDKKLSFRKRKQIVTR